MTRLSLIVIVFLTACTQKVSHDKALKYYVTINIEIKKATSEVNSFWNQAGILIKKAIKNEDIKIDTLKQAYEISQLSIVSAIDKISLIEEIDSDMKIKEKIILLLNDTKQMGEKGWPIVFKLLKSGIDKETNEQRELLRKVYLTAGELKIRHENINKLLLNFQNKYQISNDELKENGL